jgi:hypothetical protein
VGWGCLYDGEGMSEGIEVLGHTEERGYIVEFLGGGVCGAVWRRT